MKTCFEFSPLDFQVRMLVVIKDWREDTRTF